jgi:hypothetical protein
MYSLGVIPFIKTSKCYSILHLLEFKNEKDKNEIVKFCHKNLNQLLKTDFEKEIINNEK